MLPFTIGDDEHPFQGKILQPQRRSLRIAQQRTAHAGSVQPVSGTDISAQNRSNQLPVYTDKLGLPSHASHVQGTETPPHSVVHDALHERSKRPTPSTLFLSNKSNVTPTSPSHSEQLPTSTTPQSWNRNSMGRPLLRSASPVRTDRYSLSEKPEHASELRIPVTGSSLNHEQPNRSYEDTIQHGQLQSWIPPISRETGAPSHSRNRHLVEPLPTSWIGTSPPNYLQRLRIAESLREQNSCMRNNDSRTNLGDNLPLEHRGSRPSRTRILSRSEPLVDARSITERAEVYSQEFVVDHLVSHEHNPQGRLLYRVRWYGYPSGDDTLEPIDHLPRSKVIEYHRRTRTGLPTSLGRARIG